MLGYERRFHFIPRLTHYRRNVLRFKLGIFPLNFYVQFFSTVEKRFFLFNCFTSNKDWISFNFFFCLFQKGAS